MGEGLEELQQKIGRYRRRYYLDLAIRGVIFTGIALISYFLIAALAEHALWFNSWMRFGILVAFVCLVAYCLWIFLGKPLRWWISGAGLEDETVARLIGTRFPSIADRLLNALQLSKDPSPLAKASVLTRSEEFRTVAFEETIRLDENKKYLKYLWPLLLVILLILIFNQKILTGSTDRIVHFSQHYSPQAPFQFKILNDELAAYYNEDFELGVRLEGEALPEAVYIVSDGRELKMIRLPDGRFTYTFEKLQQEIAFQLKAAGFYSEPSRIGMLMRPEMTSLRMDLSFPRYTNRKREELTNQGNLSVPEGTVVHWRIGTQHTKTGLLKIGQQQIPLQEFGNQLFEATNTFRDPQQYQIILQHDSIRNREPIVYQVEVIKDHYPEIVATPYLDSVQLSQLFVSGLIRDDYGFSKLLLGYQIVKAGKQQPLVEKHIPMQTTSITQNFFYRLPIDSLQLGAGDELRYFVEVWDNDQVNGSKAARSSLFTLTLPGREELYDKVREGETSETRDIDRGVQKAQSLRESIQEMTQRLKGKQQLDWQDKSMLEQIVQQKNELQELVQKLSEENKKLESQREGLSEHDERMKEKAQQIQKLMDELLDEETRKLFRQLEDLMREKADPDQLNKLLEKLDRKELNLEKELDRMKQIFEQFKFDTKLEQFEEELDQAIEKQEQLKSETDELNKSDRPDKSDQLKDLSKRQEELLKQSSERMDALRELKDLQKKLEEEESLPGEEDLKEVEEDQEDSKNDLEQGKPEKSSQSQQRSIEKMKQMKNALASERSAMQMNIDMANLESLRQILHGLIKLSFDQERTMKDYIPLNAADPRNVTLSQSQLKIQDDAKVLEDSLLSLSKKDPMMGSMVTREVGELNNHLDRTAEFVKDRKRANAGSEMQMAMTSINDLALMLNDHFDMMMDMISKGRPGMKKGKDKGQSLSKMQQMLNQQIEQMKNGSKPGGREFSEQMARMAAEQERIRRALQELQEKMEQQGGKLPGGDLSGKMEETELDLVNKRITEETIKRQKEILTRLLEAEKSAREQDEDEERKGETAKEYEKQIPKAFSDYLRLKEKELELLRTVPPRLFPYYKKEVNEYFNRIGPNH